ncbi:MAG TPA: PilZ domain-containing protein [Candidatus Acidoferrum sp.]|nr:PilZ domain-containing protein [Candidatus Acidoferrum sp.]
MTTQTSMRSTSPSLKVWERIEIRVGDGPDAGKYVARVQDFLNGGVVITDPEFLGGSALLREDADVTILLTREDAAYQFHSQIKRISSRGKRQLILTPPRRLERVQRRLFVRVEMLREISWAPVKPHIDWGKYEEQLEWHHGHTVDVSGGGVQLRMDQPIAAETPLIVKIGFFRELALSEVLPAVVRRTFQRHGERYCGLEFLATDQLPRYFRPEELAHMPLCLKQFDRNAQNRLVSYLFNVQIDMRKKGLL